MISRPFEIVCLALLDAVCAFGGSIALPDAPPPEFADLECATNIPLRAATLQSAAIFEASISLLATPSNSVEVAFGTSRDGNGILLPGDETLAFGWNGGDWFFAAPTGCVDSAGFADGARRSLSFSLRIAENGRPGSLAVFADGSGTAFADLETAPPDLMFSRSWDTVRLTVRGVDDPAEAVSVRFDRDPVVFLVR